MADLAFVNKSIVHLQNIIEANETLIVENKRLTQLVGDSGWVSVEDRLPESSFTCFVQLDSVSVIFRGQYYQTGLDYSGKACKGWSIHTTEGWRKPRGEVTDWIKSPQPPKAQS